MGHNLPLKVYVRSLRKLEKLVPRIQNGLKAALSATPEQYPALWEEYRQYALLPEEYAAKLLAF